MITLQYLRGVVFGINLFDNALKDSFGIEDEGLAQSAHGDFAVVAFLAPRAEGLEHSGCRVAKQRERQVILLFELDVRSLAVLAYAKDLIALREESMVVIADIARLSRTAGR